MHEGWAMDASTDPRNPTPDPDRTPGPDRTPARDHHAGRVPDPAPPANRGDVLALTASPAHGRLLHRAFEGTGYRIRHTYGASAAFEAALQRDPRACVVDATFEHAPAFLQRLRAAPQLCTTPALLMIDPDAPPPPRDLLSSQADAVASWAAGPAEVLHRLQRMLASHGTLTRPRAPGYGHDVRGLWVGPLHAPASDRLADALGPAGRLSVAEDVVLAWDLLTRLHVDLLAFSPSLPTHRILWLDALTRQDPRLRGLWKLQVLDPHEPTTSSPEHRPWAHETLSAEAPPAVWGHRCRSLLDRLRAEAERARSAAGAGGPRSLGG